MAALIEYFCLLVGCTLLFWNERRFNRTVDLVGCVLLLTGTAIALWQFILWMG